LILSGLSGPSSGKNQWRTLVSCSFWYPRKIATDDFSVNGTLILSKKCADNEQTFYNVNTRC
ncbi:MAG: hypothetical protein PVG78_03060, partial [Desulfobacterales bacterium]